MQTTLMIKIVAPGLLALLLSPAVFAQEKPKRTQPQKPAIDLEMTDSRRVKPPSGPSFYIAPIEGSKLMFTALLGDGAGKTVAGTFTLQQVVVFEAVLQAAQKFALTDEKVGSGTPITTRFIEQYEWSLFVDVSKSSNQSRFYVSLVTPQGKLTIDAGEITRGSKKEPSALFFNILSQVQSVKAGVTPQQ